MHIFQNVGHKFVVVLIRRNCFKIGIYVNFFLGGRGARACSPLPSKRRCHFLWLFSVKRSNRRDQPLTIKILLSWSFFFFSWSVWYFTEKFVADHKEELKVKFHDYHIYINVNHSLNCWIVIHHFEKTLIKLQHWTVIALIIILYWCNFEALRLQ